MTSAILTPVESKILVILNDYYNTLDDTQLNIIMNILNPKLNSITNKISLRFIEWVVIHYCLKYKISINRLTGEIIPVNIKNISFINNTNIINIYNNYKIQLQVNSKEYFDLFKRQKRIEYTFKNQQKIITTLGQLNFLKWIFENNIITYIINDYKNLHDNFIIFSEVERKNKQLNKIKKTTSSSIKKKNETEQITLSSSQSISITPGSLSMTI